MMKGGVRSFALVRGHVERDDLREAGHTLRRRVAAACYRERENTAMWAGGIDGVRGTLA